MKRDSQWAGDSSFPVSTVTASWVEEIPKQGSGQPPYQNLGQGIPKVWTTRGQSLKRKRNLDSVKETSHKIDTTRKKTIIQKANLKQVTIFNITSKETNQRKEPLVRMH